MARKLPTGPLNLHVAPDLTDGQPQPFPVTTAIPPEPEVAWEPPPAPEAPKELGKADPLEEALVLQAGLEAREAVSSLLPADFFPGQPVLVRLRNWTAAAVIAENVACQDVARRNRNSRGAQEIARRVRR